MTRTKLLALFLLDLALMNACQSYTSGLQQSVARADETGAIALIRTIYLAERTYSLSNDGEYATLDQLVKAGFLDTRYAGEKPLRGYLITLNVTPKAAGAAEGTYSCNLDPEKTPGLVGRHFYVDSSATGIHVNDTQPASAADKLIE